MFSCEFCEISKNTFLHKTPLFGATVYCKTQAIMYQVYKWISASKTRISLISINLERIAKWQKSYFSVTATEMFYCI